MSDDPDACPKPRLEEACKALCSKYVVAYQVSRRWCCVRRGEKCCEGRGAASERTQTMDSVC